MYVIIWYILILQIKNVCRPQTVNFCIYTGIKSGCQNRHSWSATIVQHVLANPTFFLDMFSSLQISKVITDQSDVLIKDSSLMLNIQKAWLSDSQKPAFSGRSVDFQLIGAVMRKNGDWIDFISLELEVSCFLWVTQFSYSVNVIFLIWLLFKLFYIKIIHQTLVVLS